VCCLRLLERVEIGEVAVGQDGIRERPQMLGWLQLWRVGRQEQEMHVLRHAQVGARVPARTVQDQHNLLLRSGPNGTGERGQFDLKKWDAHAGGQVEDGTTRGGVHEADEIAPGIAVLDGRKRPDVVERPHFPNDWLEANAMFIDGPQLYARVGKRRCHLAQERPQAGDKFSLGRWVGPDVAWSRRTPAGAQAAQIAPAGLPAHPVLDALVDPGGHGAPTPPVAIRVRSGSWLMRAGARGGEGRSANSNNSVENRITQQSLRSFQETLSSRLVPCHAERLENHLR
jgi:hypothetical protein